MPSKIIFALVVLVGFCASAEARTHRYETSHRSHSCDNNGRCVLAGNIMYGEERERPRHYHKAKKSKKVAHRRSRTSDTKHAKPRWNMVTVKTVQGLYLTVHPAYAHKFLRLFEILAQNNVEVPRSIVGCYSRGGHVRGSNHYIGAACDIQTGWNKTIPALYHAGKWIRQAGLYDGCDFGDCGHIEGIKGTHNAKRVPNMYTAMAKFKADESTAHYQP